METIRKFYCFLVLAAFVFATIGCTGYLFYFRKPQFAVAALALAGMAVPYVLKCARELGWFEKKKK